MPPCPTVGTHSHRYPTVLLLLVNKTECCFASEKAVDVMTIRGDQCVLGCVFTAETFYDGW